jgi:hypothetical protein
MDILDDVTEYLLAAFLKTWLVEATVTMRCKFNKGF